MDQSPLAVPSIGYCQSPVEGYHGVHLCNYYHWNQKFDTSEPNFRY